jgi:hypothetical protein
MNKLLIINPCHSLTPGMEISTLTELDHVINMLSHSLGPDKSSLNTSVTNDLGGEGTEQSLTLIGGLAKFSKLFAMAHHREIRTSSRCTTRICRGIDNHLRACEATGGTHS